MSTNSRVTEGKAYIDGSCVADVEVEETYAPRMVAVPIPGVSSDGVKDLGRWQQSYVRFSNVASGLGARLQTLIDSVEERRRRLRDRQGNAAGTLLVLDDGRDVELVSVSAASDRYARVEEVWFPVGGVPTARA